jgi:hypothetical protein
MEGNMKKIEFVSSYQGQGDYMVYGIPTNKDSFRVSTHEDDTFSEWAGCPVISMMAEFEVTKEIGLEIIKLFSKYSEDRHLEYLRWCEKMGYEVESEKTEYPKALMYLSAPGEGWGIIKQEEERS